MRSQAEVQRTLGYKANPTVNGLTVSEIISVSALAYSLRRVIVASSPSTFTLCGGRYSCALIVSKRREMRCLQPRDTGASRLDCSIGLNTDYHDYLTRILESEIALRKRSFVNAKFSPKV
ncbi:hypothetical protein Tco_1078633 [Tanacetum coccineum]|uniref:Uncharacterized protein n=1 Tax=Tanacetum coccineum TaxID=301880 RepID=A0ABQ5HPP0_9ASTR